MDGILNVNKPIGCTSFDVVRKIRQITGERKVGHAGTLDPDASGVLVVCLGKATRAAEYLSELPKSYLAVIRFGIETDTEDSSGNVIKITECSSLTESDVENVLHRFVGDITQIPPMVSAVHHQGQRLYKLARAGIQVNREPRSVKVYSIKLIDFTPGEHPCGTLQVICSRGTYVRTLCADMGKALGCGAHMESLIRMSIGGFDIESAVTLEDITAYANEGRINDIIIPINEALSFTPCVILDDCSAARIANGEKLELDGYPEIHAVQIDAPVRICGQSKELIAIGRFITKDLGNKVILKPDKVFVDKATKE